MVLEEPGRKPERPLTTFDAVIKGGPMKVLETAATVENLGAAAYLGQAGRIQSKEILAAALAIHSVEGRHAAALNQAVGKTIVPDGARQAGLHGGGHAAGQALPQGDVMRNPELATIDVQGVTRQSFLVKGAIAAGSVYGLSPWLPSFPRRSRRRVAATWRS